MKVNYTKMARIACGFFATVAAIWLIVTAVVGHRFNPTALILTVGYSALLWYRNRIANLVAGVLSLFFSFFMLMDVLSTFDLLTKNRDFGMAAAVLLGIAVAGIVFSVFLILSFTKELNEPS